MFVPVFFDKSIGSKFTSCLKRSFSTYFGWPCNMPASFDIESKLGQFLFETFRFSKNLCICCCSLISDGPTNDIKRRFFVVIKFLMALEWEQGRHMHDMKWLPNYIFLAGLGLMYSPETIQNYHQIDITWDRSTVRTLEVDFPKHKHGFLPSLF